MVDVPLSAPPAGVDEDAWMAACAAVRAYCGWHVAPSVTETVTVDGSGGGVQMLPTLRLTELDSITNDGAVVTDPEWSASGMVRAHRWTSKFRGVTATMTHGYDNCPAEILTVLTELADDGVPAGATSISSGPFRVGFGSDGASAASLLPGHRGALDAYRIARVA